MFDILPRTRLAFLPTPLHPMRNLGKELGLDNLWIKRDDMTGPGFGGNKTRKLEFVIGDAKQQGCDTLVTVGALQSNHCRQTAAAAAAAGMRCVLLLGGEEPDEYTGNLLLDAIYGAEIKFFPNEGFLPLNDRLASVVTTLEELGLKPYAVPAGAATPIGSLAYAAAIQELKQQLDRAAFSPERIIVATSTGGTLAGMIAGQHMMGLDAEILGLNVYDSADAATSRVRDLLQRMMREYPSLVEKFKPAILIDDRFIGEGYAVMGDPERKAIEMFARLEGVLLDPVYTGKAGVGLIQMAMSGEIPSDSPTLFWHTGGQPALFAYSQELHQRTAVGGSTDAKRKQTSEAGEVTDGF
ncbi:MAG: D-cysteine desulfhydrase family protein [Candidatus Thorarchaeota archaeon]|nr:MAG: D-cysteine desulfhydrase family protein [Candidatus Thorarchaeota archaeon]